MALASSERRWRRLGTQTPTVIMRLRRDPRPDPAGVDARAGLCLSRAFIQKLISLIETILFQ